ncbi:MAG TPA: methyltransferase domain-containing protein [Alphaproteobacteria bacterium]|nr:methyltransferase domain-containing protein [Alphaproteobacteria bacterium]
MTDAMTVFDRSLVRRHRDRAAPGLAAHGFLFDEVAERLAERLDDIRRGFARILDLGCHDGAAARALAGRPGVELLVQADLSPAMAARAAANGRPAVAADEELLPFAPASFDLVTSCLSLHWVNDLPGALIQIRRVLRPDGFFLGAILGGDTLFELRRALQETEMALSGGLSPRISPMAEVRDVGGLLQRAGFALPVVDSDTLTVTYPDAFRLMAELRGMGEANAVLERHRRPAGRALMVEAARRYQAMFAGPDGRIPATFQVLYLAGWAPHESQQKPLRPGSAKTRLADALRVEERPASEPAAPPARSAN